MGAEQVWVQPDTGNPFRQQPFVPSIQTGRVARSFSDERSPDRRNSHLAQCPRPDITTPQLAVDGQIEHGQITDSLVDLELGPDRPDVFRPQGRLGSNQLSFVPGYPPGGGQRKIGVVLHGRTPLVAEEDDLAVRAGRLRNRVRFQVPAQPIDATQALNLSAGVSNCKVSRGRSLS
jgi:hypothetical protein